MGETLHGMLDSIMGAVVIDDRSRVDLQVGLLMVMKRANDLPHSYGDFQLLETFQKVGEALRSFPTFLMC